jgi:hypothetical protein
MYTIGTSAIAWIRTQITDDAILTALRGKLVGYVGTAADRNGDAGFPPTFISPYSVFFECASASGEPHVIATPITSVTVYKPMPEATPVPTSWTSVGTLIQAQVTNILLPAGAIKNGAYQFSRGNKADRDSALRVDGLPYYARDDEVLFVWDSIKHDWAQLSFFSIPVGSIITYHQHQALVDTRFFARCDGTVVLITQYQELYNAIGKLYDDPEDPTDATHFRLPKQNNSLIRIKT